MNRFRLPAFNTFLITAITITQGYMVYFSDFPNVPTPKCVISNFDTMNCSWEQIDTGINTTYEMRFIVG